MEFMIKINIKFSDNFSCVMEWNNVQHHKQYADSSFENSGFRNICGGGMSTATKIQMKDRLKATGIMY